VAGGLEGGGWTKGGGGSDLARNLARNVAIAFAKDFTKL